MRVAPPGARVRVLAGRRGARLRRGRGARAAGRPVRVAPWASRARCAAREVGEFRWAARARRARLARAVRPARPRRDPRRRAGRASRRGRSARTSRTSRSRADGAHVALLQHTTRGGYSVDLAARARSTRREGRAGGDRRAGRLRVRLLARRARGSTTGRAAPGTARRAISSASRPAGRRGDEARAGRAGREELRVRPARPGAAPRHLAAHRTSSRSTSPSGRTGKLVSIDTAVLPGSAHFLGPDSRRVVYAVAQPKRAGVYVAELPK